MKQKNRFLSLLLCGTLVVSNLSQTTAFAETNAAQNIGTAIKSGICEHHPEHTSDCGYTGGVRRRFPAAMSIQRIAISL